MGSSSRPSSIISLDAEFSVTVFITLTSPLPTIIIGDSVEKIYALKKFVSIDNHGFSFIRRLNSASASLFGLRFPLKYLR